jgi:hypothetical protein
VRRSHRRWRPAINTTTRTSSSRAHSSRLASTVVRHGHFLRVRTESVCLDSQLRVILCSVGLLIRATFWLFTPRMRACSCSCRLAFATGRGRRRPLLALRRPQPRNGLSPQAQRRVLGVPALCPAGCPVDTRAHVRRRAQRHRQQDLRLAAVLCQHPEGSLRRDGLLRALRRLQVPPQLFPVAHNSRDQRSSNWLSATPGM